MHLSPAQARTKLQLRPQMGMLTLEPRLLTSDVVSVAQQWLQSQWPEQTITIDTRSSLSSFACNLRIAINAALESVSLSQKLIYNCAQQKCEPLPFWQWRSKLATYGVASRRRVHAI